MGKSNTTDVVIRISTGHGKSEQNNTDTYAILNVVSAFGPSNLHNVYTVRLPADFVPPADVNAEDEQYGAISGRFDIRNGKSGAWLGTWVIARIPGKHTLWDATDVPQSSAPKPAAAKPQITAQSDVRPIPEALNGLVLGSAPYRTRTTV